MRKHERKFALELRIPIQSQSLGKVSQSKKSSFPFHILFWDTAHPFAKNNLQLELHFSAQASVPKKESIIST